MKKGETLKRLVIFIWLAVFTVLCVGCTHPTAQPDDQNEEEIELVLTQRQKDILASEGLPTEWSELTARQQRGIIAIERYMSYLDETYDDSFTFTGYYPLDIDNSREHLKAECSLGVVTVYRKYIDGEFVYEDNYRCLQAVQPYENALKNYVDEYLNGIPVFIHVTVWDVDEDANLTGDPLSLLRSISASCSMIFDAADVPSDNLAGVAEQFAAWLQPLLGGNRAGAVEIYSMDSDRFLTLNMQNFYDFLMEMPRVHTKITCDISLSGEINFF